jgi:hypothetical protein
MIHVSTFFFGPPPSDAFGNLIGGIIGVVVGVGALVDAVRGIWRVGFVWRRRAVPAPWYLRVMLIFAGVGGCYVGVALMLRGFAALR